MSCGRSSPTSSVTSSTTTSFAGSPSSALVAPLGLLFVRELGGRPGPAHRRRRSRPRRAARVRPGPGPGLARARGGGEPALAPDRGERGHLRLGAHPRPRALIQVQRRLAIENVADPDPPAIVTALPARIPRRSIGSGRRWRTSAERGNLSAAYYRGMPDPLEQLRVHDSLRRGLAARRCGRVDRAYPRATAGSGAGRLLDQRRDAAGPGARAEAARDRRAPARGARRAAGGERRPDRGRRPRVRQRLPDRSLAPREPRLPARCRR